MGLTKRWLEEVEAEEDMLQWIKERADLGVEEGDPEWEALKHEYLEGGGGIDYFEYWDEEDDGFQWLEEDGRAFDIFNEQMKVVQSFLMQDTYEPTLLKMYYSYIVTLMESCLSDMLKHLIMSDDFFLKNAMKNIQEVSEVRLTLPDVYNEEDIVKKRVLKVLSEYLYHNVRKIIPIIIAVTGDKKIPDDIRKYMGDIVKVVKLRHDIVHRNGYDVDGGEQELSRTILEEAYLSVINFVSAVYNYINRAKIKNLLSEGI